jgi:hypothetical protein
MGQEFVQPVITFVLPSHKADHRIWAGQDYHLANVQGKVKFMLISINLDSPQQASLTNHDGSRIIHFLSFNQMTDGNTSSPAYKNPTSSPRVDPFYILMPCYMRLQQVQFQRCHEIYHRAGNTNQNWALFSIPS